jgi:hypothetical protein
MDDVVQVSASGVFFGPSFTMAIKSDGSLWAWGGDWFGQLGNGTAAEGSLTPIKIMDDVMLPPNAPRYNIWQNPFADVSESDWFYEDVKTAHESGLLNGTSATTFSPDDSLTYAQAVKLAACMHQLYTTGAVTLTPGSPAWYQSYADYAKANQIIAIDYDWDAPAPRAGYIEIFAYALPDAALAEINSIADGAIPDVPKSHENAAAIYRLYRAGIVQGVNAARECNPSSHIRRSEVAAILTRMMDASMRVRFTLGGHDAQPK